LPNLIIALILFAYFVVSVEPIRFCIYKQYSLPFLHFLSKKSLFFCITYFYQGSRGRLVSTET